MPTGENRGTRKFCKLRCRDDARNTRRRDARRHATTHRVCALDGCVAEWRIAGYRAEKIFCSKPHSTRAANMRPRVKALRKRQQTNMRNATTGRVCRYCKRDDTGRQFQREELCTRCARGINRNKCGECGGPAYKIPTRANGGVIGCLVASGLPLGFRCKDEV